MPTQITIDDDAPIFIELNSGRGVVDAARISPEELAKKSAEAFNNAMSTIASVAKRTITTMRSLKLHEQADTVEMTFGLKLTTEANAFIVNAGLDAQIEVKLIWNNDKKQLSPEANDG